MTGRGEEIGRDGLETVETGETSSVNAGWGDVCLLAAVGCECRRRRAVALHALVTRHAGVVCAAGLSQRPCVCVCVDVPPSSSVCASSWAGHLSSGSRSRPSAVSGETLETHVWDLLAVSGFIEVWCVLLCKEHWAWEKLCCLNYSFVLGILLNII